MIWFLLALVALHAGALLMSTKENLRLRRREAEVLQVLEEKDKRIADITAVAADATRKLEASLSANQAFQTSRDQIWDMYRRSSIASGHAQAWLSRDLGAAIVQLNAYRKLENKPPVEVDAGLQDLLSEYQTQHVAAKEIP